MARKRRARVLPGFGLSLGYTFTYLSLIVLVPLSAVLIKTSSLSITEFWNVGTTPRVVASYKLSFGASLAAAGINAVPLYPLLSWVVIGIPLLI